MSAWGGGSDNPFAAPAAARPAVGTADNPFRDGGNEFVVAPEDDAGPLPSAAADSPFGLRADAGQPRASPNSYISSESYARKMETPSPGAGGSASTSGLNGTPTTQRELDLERREAELERREQEVQRLIKETGYKPKNWPSCYPILYHDIAAEIPADNRMLVRWAYYSWMLTVAAWLWFWFSVLLGVIFDANKLLGGFSNFVVNSMATVIGLWVSWNVNYRTLFRAARIDSVLSYGWFFLNHTAHIGWWCWCAVGVPALNYPPGFMTMLDALGVNTFAGVIYAIAFAFDVLVAGFSTWVQLYAIKKFRGQGGVAELTRQGQAAATAVRAANTLNSASGGFQSSPAIP